MLATTSNLAAADCDRACLKTLLDQDLNAMIKQDPAADPLFVGFRQTENAVGVRPGIGVGKTLTGLGKVQRRYFDAVTAPPAVSGCTSGLANINILYVFCTSPRGGTR